LSGELNDKRTRTLAVLFLPLIRFRMINHATSAVLAINSPSPINAIPTTRSFGSASSSFNFVWIGSKPLIKKREIIKIIKNIKQHHKPRMSIDNTKSVMKRIPRYKKFKLNFHAG